MAPWTCRGGLSHSPLPSLLQGGERLPPFSSCTSGVNSSRLCPSQAPHSVPGLRGAIPLGFSGAGRTWEGFLERAQWSTGTRKIPQRGRKAGFET